MSQGEFVHLHNHTEYSLLDGACKISDMIDTALKLGMPALAITDHGNMFGAMEFYNKTTEKGIKPIIGSEVYVAPSGRFNRNSKESSHHLVLLAKNEKGYKNLMELVSRGYLEGFYYRARVDRELLEEYHEGLIALSACIQGQVPWLLLADQERKAQKAADDLRQIFGEDNFYIELQYHQLEKEKEAMPKLIKLAKKLEIPMVVTNDCHYINQEDSAAHEVLLAIQTGKTIDDSGRLSFGSDEFHFRTPDEMRALFPDIPELMTNTLEIAEKCNVEMNFDVVIPDIELPEGHNPDSYLEELARKGIKERYSNPAKEVEERLQYELALIRETGFATFFLMAREVVNFAQSRGISVGPGRGSAAGSIVSYSIGVTKLDPLKHGLVFERFLNPERITPPDFDIDFDSTRRGEIVEYMIERYGRESTAQIITYNRLMAKAAIKDVGRVLGMPLEEVTRIANLVPKDLGMTLDKALETVPDLQQIANDPEKGKIIKIAKALEGIARNASVHAAGVIVTKGKATQYVPLYKTSRDEIVTQYDMKILEWIGVNKLDILGLDALPMIDHTLRLIEENHHVKLDLEKIDMDDEKTYKMLGEGRTLGVFQLGGQGMVDLVIKLQPKCFEDIVPIVSLYRPGPIQSGMMDEYIGRKLGTIPIEYTHPVLEPILKDTYGTMVYQEQIMKIGRDMAGFTLGQTDVLRRAMGKKKISEIEKQRGPFIEGAKKKGIPAEVAEGIFEQMIPFSGYCFNQSHTTAYALVTYHTAYLKAHYPVEFMAAGMTSTKEKQDSSGELIKYLKECQKQEIDVLPPDINESFNEFTVKGQRIRFGLCSVKNVGESAIEAIIAARDEKGPFKTLFDFCERVDIKSVNRKCVESLIKCGAFDSLEGHRAQLLAALDSAMEAGQSAQKDREVGQVSLFDFAESFSTEAQKLPEVPKLGDMEKLAMEKEILGFYISGHPLMRYDDIIKEYTNANTTNLDDFESEDKISLAGMINSIRYHTTKNDKQMAFVSLEDLDGVVDLVIFAEALEKCSSSLEDGKIVWVRGSLGNGQPERETHSIIVEELLCMEEAKRKFTDSLHVHLKSEAIETSLLESLKSMCLSYKGNCDLYLHFKTPQYGEVVVQANPDTRVAPSDELISQIEQLFGERSVWLGSSKAQQR
ncbi:DNA polymerase III subunit alpha [Candidatus Poribacteria bacterium]|nr:DNA polymerase III subunit alpha [Candidatus Poribacteria bacterium]